MVRAAHSKPQVRVQVDHSALILDRVCHLNLDSEIWRFGNGIDRHLLDLAKFFV